MTSTLTPAVFVGHGSPMNALQANAYTEAWRSIGAALGRPRAILAVSAHWYINASAVTAMERPRTIHDFFGFPEALATFRYDAPGDPALCDEIAEVVAPTWIGRDLDSWGLDHGTWSVLAHMFPAADVPVVQLSVDGSKDVDYHVRLGAALAPLRRRGVAIVASGNVVHNLPRIDTAQGTEPYGWAREFDDAAQAVMTGAPGDVASLAGHEHYALAAPTPDHFLPLLYVGGLAAEAGTTARSFNQGWFGGSLSMTSYVVEG